MVSGLKYSAKLILSCHALELVRETLWASPRKRNKSWFRYNVTVPLVFEYILFHPCTLDCTFPLLAEKIGLYFFHMHQVNIAQDLILDAGLFAEVLLDIFPVSASIFQ